jgi:hypothetical protein
MLAKERNQRLRLERLSQIAERSARPGALGEHIFVRGDKNDRRRVPSSLEQILKIESAQSPEVDVEDDAFGVPRHPALEKLLGGSEGLDANPIHAKGARERRAEGRIVVDDADPRALKVRCQVSAGVLRCLTTPTSMAGTSLMIPARTTTSIRP